MTPRASTAPSDTPAATPDALARMRRLRWTSFVLVSAAYVLSFFHRIAPAAIAGELRRAFDASGAELGALAATYFLVYTLMQIPTGILVDALGPRRIVAVGGVVAAAGSILFGAASTLRAAAIGRALVGLGVSVAFISLLKLVAAWFREREFATLSGLVQLLGNLGAVLSAAPLAWAVTLVSWRTVFVVLGLLSIAGATVTWLLVRDDPRDAGLPSMRELDGERAHAPRAGAWHAGLREVARNRATWPGFFVNMGMGGAFLAFAGLWAVPFLTDVQGMTRARATAHTTVMLIAFAVGSLATGKVSDRLRRRRAPMLVLGAIHALCWAVLARGVAPSGPGLFVLFGVMGASATAFTLSWASVKEVNAPALSGTAMAVVNTGVFLGPTVYQPLVGWVADRAGLQRGLGVLAVAALAGLAAALLVRETGARNVAEPAATASR